MAKAKIQGPSRLAAPSASRAMTAICATARSGVIRPDESGPPGASRSRSKYALITLLEPASSGPTSTKPIRSWGKVAIRWSPQPAASDPASMAPIGRNHCCGRISVSASFQAS
ncbi:hypothetical protein D3C87_1010750 [compost metagenome]